MDKNKQDKHQSNPDRSKSPGDTKRDKDSGNQERTRD